MQEQSYIGPSRNMAIPFLIKAGYEVAAGEAVQKNAGRGKGLERFVGIPIKPIFYMPR